MDVELLTLNGINGADGRYLVPPMTVEDLGRMSAGHQWRPEHYEDLEARQEKGSVFALRADLNNQKLSEAGWGVIFPADAEPATIGAIREALSELLDHRQDQAGDLYREYYRDPRIGYIQGESKEEFLERHGAGPGPVDPSFVPYYLLIVSDPQSIPFEFQYELDVQYAVGRIHFESLDEYAHYARSVVKAETPGQVNLPRQATFFGVANEDDGATQLSATSLVSPLAEYVAAQQQKLGWERLVVPPQEATKERLIWLLGGDQTPAFLFTASHGLGFPHGHKHQFPFQGALLCGDWPGPRNAPPGPVKRDHYLGAEDIDDNAQLLGLVAFHFACYGAATPYWDNFAQRSAGTRSALAPHAFLAALPRRLLGHPQGGALAIIGHVDRAWSYSFEWKGAGAQTAVFEDVLFRLLNGETVGAALDAMNLRYAEIATMLQGVKKTVAYQRPWRSLAGLWTANNDARDYAIVGDPAVRIPVAQVGAEPAERPIIEPPPGRDGEVPAVLVSDALPGGQEPSPPTEDPAPPQYIQPAHYAPPQTVLDGLAAISRYEAADAEDYALPGLDNIKEIAASLSYARKGLASKLSDVAVDVTSLEVSTYVADNMSAIQHSDDNKHFTEGATLRAITRVSPDGDTQVCVPIQASDLDDTLWAIHSEMVNQALANRTAMMKAVADALVGLLGVSGSG